MIDSNFGSVFSEVFQMNPQRRNSQTLHNFDIRITLEILISSRSSFFLSFFCNLSGTLEKMKKTVVYNQCN